MFMINMQIPLTVSFHSFFLIGLGIYFVPLWSVCFQVINNACATQAIISVLLNCSHPDMLLGDTLTEFREFSQSFDAAVRQWYFCLKSK